MDNDNALSSSTSINGNTHIMPTVIHFLSSWSSWSLLLREVGPGQIGCSCADVSPESTQRIVIIIIVMFILNHSPHPHHNYHIWCGYTLYIDYIVILCSAVYKNRGRGKSQHWWELAIVCLVKTLSRFCVKMCQHWKCSKGGAGVECWWLEAVAVSSL